MSDEIKLSDRIWIAPNCGFVSINEALELSEGYDNALDLTAYEGPRNLNAPRFTREELLELTRVMVARWLAFGVAVEEGHIPLREEVAPTR